MIEGCFPNETYSFLLERFFYKLLDQMDEREQHAFNQWELYI